MDRSRSPAWQTEVERTLLAFGGRGTLGDLIVTTGLPRLDVERSLEGLMADEHAQVAVSETGVLVYRLDERQHQPLPDEGPRRHTPALLRRRSRLPSGTSSVGFDRKTLRLIRARGGVLSMAELIEHTGLPLCEAREEMERLVELYGGEAHPSWDGHIVYAFPELMVSVHGDFAVREPRPAWVRCEDPMRRSKKRPLRAGLELIGSGIGLLASASPLLALPWVGVEVGAASLGLVIASSVVGVFVFGRGILRALRRTGRYRFRDADTLRRYALGYVFETALKGKGVVSLERTVQVLQRRAGKRKVSRSGVERALRQLAEEFDAPITELDGDRFFGFRNVKRQFLASHVQRARLQLARMAGGRTVFDSGDSPVVAAQRELEAFDRALRDEPPLRVG